MKPKGQDCYSTPDYIYNHYYDIFNFNLDVAADNENAKCLRYFTEEDNALEQDWYGRVWCNPPFSLKAKFAKKAHEQIVNKNISVCIMILPLNSISASYFHDFIEGKYHYQILQNRISFIDPETGKPRSGNNTGTVVVFFMEKVLI